MSKKGNYGQHQYVTELFDFIEQFEVYKDSKSKDVKITHYTVGKPYKSYAINSDSVSTFIKKYAKAVVALGLNDSSYLHFGEMPVEIGPIIFDIDFRQATPKRLYRFSHIKAIIAA